jgi:hypothetical protein
VFARMVLRYPDAHPGKTRTVTESLPCPR